MNTITDQGIANLFMPNITIEVMWELFNKCLKLFFMEIFDDAIKLHDGHGYLFLDFKQQTQDRMRIQTGIIPDEERIIYTIKN